MPTELQQKLDWDNRLSHNESPIPPEFKALQALKGIPFNRYPESDYRVLSEKLAHMNSLNREQIIVANGSDECIRLIIDAFTKPGDSVVIPVPTFTQYSHQVSVCYRKAFELPQKNFVIDTLALIEACNRHNPALLFICSPNNPTGFVIEEGSLRHLLEETTCTVVLDEAYVEFSGTSLAHLIHDYPKLLVLRTLSKAYAMAGLRIGYCLSTPSNILALNKVRGPYALSSLSAAIALELLADVTWMQDGVNQVIAERQQFYNFLKSCRGISPYESQGNFILINASKAFDTLKTKLSAASIEARYYTEDLLENHLRITIGSSETMVKVRQVITEALL